MTQFKLSLGVEAKDIVSGFKGLITARCEYLNGCKQYRIDPRGVKDGKLQDGIWIDEGQILVIGKGISSSVTQKETGGPQANTPKGQF